MSKTQPLVIKNSQEQFLVMGSTTKWSDEYPDASKFGKGTKRTAVRIAGEVKGKVIANYGQQDEKIIADCTPKVWLVTLSNGKTIQLPEMNASDILENVDDHLYIGDTIRSAVRILNDDGTPVSANDYAINEAVRTLVERTANTEMGNCIVMLSNDGKAPYILPALIFGAVEYQVSDGIDGKRGTSYDSYTWSSAVENFYKMKERMETVTTANSSL